MTCSLRDKTAESECSTVGDRLSSAWDKVSVTERFSSLPGHRLVCVAQEDTRSKCRFFPAHPRSGSFPRNVRNWLYTLACHARLHVLQAYSTACACIRTMRAGVLSVESVALWILQEVAVDLSPPSLEEIHCASGTV